MKGSRYLVISYFRAPRLPLRSGATGERETEKEKRERERERGPRPITSPVRVTGDRGRGSDGKKESEKKRRTHAFAASPSLLPCLSSSSFSDSPFDSWLPSPYVSTSPSFLPYPPPCPPRLLLVTLSSSLASPAPSSPSPSPHLAFQTRLRLTRHDDRLIHPFFFLFFFPPPVLKPLGREREKDRGSVNTAITALLKHRWRRWWRNGSGFLFFFSPSLSY